MKTDLDKCNEELALVRELCGEELTVVEEIEDLEKRIIHDKQDLKTFREASNGEFEPVIGYVAMNIEAMEQRLKKLRVLH